MNVPFFRYPHVFEQQRDELQEALMRVASSGGYILQRELAQFERRLAEYCGVRAAIGVGNATDALEIVASGAGLGPDDEVILPSHTFVASASAIVSAGARPVFAEVNDEHVLDPDDVSGRITERTRAIMPTQLNGRVADMERLDELANKHRLLLMEDSAQGLGARFRGRMAGTFGIAGVFSFYPAKTLGCFGDGGAIITDDEDRAVLYRELRDHGRNPQTGEVRRWGRNSRLDNLQAAVLLVKLDRLDDEIAFRRELAARYHRNLGGRAELLLPPPPDERRDPKHFDSYQNYEIEADRRDELRTHLGERGVGTILQWGGKCVHEFDALCIDQRLPDTERRSRRMMLLPMNTSLSLEEVDYVCEQIHEFYDSSSCP